MNALQNHVEGTSLSDASQNLIRVLSVSEMKPQTFALWHIARTNRAASLQRIRAPARHLRDYTIRG